MTNEPGSSGGIFDIRSLRQLVKLMNENDLTEIDLRNDAQRVRLRKRVCEVVPLVTPAPALVPGSAPRPVAAEPASPTAPPAPAVQYTEIKAPMLGTFYRASSPDAEPFVQVGSHVEKETIACIIEAMKVFNEIAAEVRGKIVAILVENGQPVEYGQPLFRVDPTG